MRSPLKVIGLFLFAFFAFTFFTSDGAQLAECFVVACIYAFLFAVLFLFLRGMMNTARGRGYRPPDRKESPR